jgi:hypothetical protein
LLLASKVPLWRGIRGVSIRILIKKKVLLKKTSLPTSLQREGLDLEITYVLL